ncbi:hypothetical protein LC612_39530, partial [Nostoc sp. CHAB 5834]|nr:hypothetical protein [Nostoc sp. CHAB 5834]
MFVFTNLRVTLSVAWTLLGSLASGQVPLRITHSVQAYPIAPVCQFALATQDSLPPPDSHFNPFKADRLDIHSDNDYWYRFSVHNLNPSPLYLVVEPYLYASVQLYESTPNGLRFLGKAGLDESRRQAWLLNNRHIFSLPLPSGQQRTYLLRLNRCWIKSLPVRVVPQKILIDTLQTHDLADGLLFGVLIGIVFFLFTLYGLSQEADYGWLGLFLALELSQELIGKGYLFTYFPLPNPQWHTSLLLMNTGLSGMVSLRFTYSFLRLNNYPLRIRQGYQLAMAGYAFFLLMAAVRCYPVFHWQTPYVIIIYFLSLLLTVYAIRRGHREARYFIAPLLVPLLFLPLLMAHRQGYESEGDSQALYLLMLVCSALLYSLAVGYKVKAYRDQAKQLVNEQNLKLEATVAERTAELHTDKQRLERQSHQLALAMQELNHRVKNNLSIVTSLLNLQGQQVRVPSVQRLLAESRQRIEVLSLLHQQLY